MAQGTETPAGPPGDAGPAKSGTDAYLHRRTLRRGSAGWLLLTGLGVAYVVSGDFSGWNIGLSKGGFGGLAVAMVLMGVMYACLVFALAELSAILPTAGGGYGFARRALGTWGGFLTGTAILIEYILAPAAISSSSATMSNRSACSASPPAGPSTSPASRSSSASTSGASARRSASAWW